MAWKQTGRKPRQLDGYEFPSLLTNVWEWFIELSGGRTYGEFGAHPLSYTNIKDWAELMRVNIHPNEVKIIKKLDNLFLSIK